MDKKTRSNYMLPKETHFGSKDTNSLKMKGWKKMLHINSNQKGVGLAILILDKILLQGTKKILYCGKWINSSIRSKEINEDLKKWKDILCSWFGRLNSKATQSNLHIQCPYYKNSIHFFFFLQKWKSQPSNSYGIAWGSKQPKQF